MKLSSTTFTSFFFKNKKIDQSGLIFKNNPFSSILYTKFLNSKRLNSFELPLSKLFNSRRNTFVDSHFKAMVNFYSLGSLTKLAYLRDTTISKAKKYLWSGFFKLAPSVFWRRISLIFLKRGLVSSDLRSVYFLYKKFSKTMSETQQKPVSSVFLKSHSFNFFFLKSVNLRRQFSSLFYFYRFSHRFEPFCTFFREHDSESYEDFLNRDFFWKKNFYVNRKISGFFRFRKLYKMYIDKDLYRGFFGFESWMQNSFIFKSSFEDGVHVNLKLKAIEKKNVNYIHFFKKYIRCLVKKCNKLRFERCLFNQIGKFSVVWFHSIWGVYFRRQRRWRLVVLNAIKKWYIKKPNKSKKHRRNIRIRLTLLMVLYKALGFFGLIAGSFSCLLHVICLFFKKTRKYWAILRVVKIVVSRVRSRLRTIKSFIMVVSGRFGNQNRKSKNFIYLGNFLKVMNITYRVEYFYAAANSKAGVFGISTWIQFTKPFWGKKFKTRKKNNLKFDLMSEFKFVNNKSTLFLEESFLK